MFACLFFCVHQKLVRICLLGSLARGRRINGPPNLDCPQGASFSVA